MDVRSAELTKYTANAFLATKISFMNEISQIAERVGADIEQVRRGISLDPRISEYFLSAGCGFGGSCFPKDVSALRRSVNKDDFDPQLLAAVESVNLGQKQVLFNKISRYFDNDLQGKVIALWGLAFKPNTDDMRQAPSRVIIEALCQAGAKVQAYDPVAINNAKQIFKQQSNIEFCDSKEMALTNADALAIITEWDDFCQPDFNLIKNTLKKPVIFDGRNLFQPKKMKQLGIEYFGIGRGEFV